jgi:hypothetical protein
LLADTLILPSRLTILTVLPRSLSALFSAPRSGSSPLDLILKKQRALNLETEGIFRAPALAEKPSLVELAGTMIYGIPAHMRYLQTSLRWWILLRGLRAHGGLASLLCGDTGIGVD